MKTKLLPLLVLLSACSGQSTNAPPAQSAAAPASAPAPEAAKKTPAETAHDELIRKAKALTEQQIDASHDLASLGRLAQIYTDIDDKPHLTWTLERLTRLLPNAGDLRLKLAATYATDEDKAKTYDLLIKMINQGYAYDLSKDPAFKDAKETRVWDYIVENFARNAKPYGEGKVAFELPKGDTLLESIAWDPKRKQFLVGSVREGKIHLADKNGKLADFINADAEHGLWGVFALAVDSAHDRLYAVSNGVPQYQGFSADIAGKADLLAFSLASGKLLNKYDLPADNLHHVLTNIAVDGKGGVYVADGINSQIYRLDNGSLRLLLGNPSLSGIRGMTVTPDGKTLYFADPALGIFGVDLSKGAPFNPAYNPQKLVLGGIDGLYWYKGTLVAIQGGMVPERVIRLKLSDDGRSIVSVTPLDAAQPAFESPTTGTVAGDDLYFIANSQKRLYSELGVLTDASALAPVRIFRSNMGFAWDDKGTDTSTTPAAPAFKPSRAQLQQMLMTPPKGVVRPEPAAAPAQNEKDH